MLNILNKRRYAERYTWHRKKMIAKISKQAKTCLSYVCSRVHRILRSPNVVYHKALHTGWICHSSEKSKQILITTCMTVKLNSFCLKFYKPLCASLMELLSLIFSSQFFIKCTRMHFRTSWSETYMDSFCITISYQVYNLFLSWYQYLIHSQEPTDAIS